MYSDMLPHLSFEALETDSSAIDELLFSDSFGGGAAAADGSAANQKLSAHVLPAEALPAEALPTEELSASSRALNLEYSPAACEPLHGSPYVDAEQFLLSAIATPERAAPRHFPVIEPVAEIPFLDLGEPGIDHASPAPHDHHAALAAHIDGEEHAAQSQHTAQESIIAHTGHALAIPHPIPPHHHIPDQPPGLQAPPARPADCPSSESHNAPLPPAAAAAAPATFPLGRPLYYAAPGAPTPFVGGCAGGGGFGYAPAAEFGYSAGYFGMQAPVAGAGAAAAAAGGGVGGGGGGGSGAGGTGAAKSAGRGRGTAGGAGGGGKRYKTTQPSKFCHVCVRSGEQVRLAACGNVSSGLCRKAVCEKCFAKHGFGREWPAAARTRALIAQAAALGSDGPHPAAWTCFHCRGLCPDSAQCKIYARTNRRRHVILKARKAAKEHAAALRAAAQAARRNTPRTA